MNSSDFSGTGRFGRGTAKMNRPLFSCVVPVKGARPYLEATMDSLRSQGLGNELEVIVQDADVEPDRGQSDALNRGFAKASGEWLFWLNADDLLMSGALEKVRNAVDKCQSAGGVEWIVGNQVLIDADGRVLKCLRANGWHDFLYREAVPHVNGPSAFFRRELLASVGGFDETLDFCMDWDLWIRFCRAGARFVRLDAYLWAQRQWDGSKTQRAKGADEERTQAHEVQRMLAKNAFRMTKLGDILMRFWRTANGNYLRGAWDTMRHRGKIWPS